ncbi:S8 family serine peptidase [Sinorhizobium meliloti]|uniref:S8 family serine peptidase n=1 Tax=Rhizobium meliloti TaxID=382 RepID=UPI000FDB3729|nr:S8 family serine peptidase [Sinorhizobium meliloti]MQX62304.1 S8 family serine peptidase [Sinorhizobium meliloti]RVI62354.1 hypothetical protein CN189_19005 [Sinorhizobium meliloti]
MSKRFGPRKYLVLAIVFGMGATTAVQAAELYTEPGVAVEWRSGNRNAADLALAIERLYVVLYNTGNLPTRSMTNPALSEVRVEQILRSERLFFGDFFPEGVDAVLCDINPGVCSREKDPVSETELARVENHVGGYRKSRGRWSNTAKSTVVVPDLKFESDAIIEAFPYTPGENLDELVSRQHVDCSYWRVHCADLVKRLNPALLDPKRKVEQRPDTILLPVQGFKTDIVLTGIEGSKLRSEVQKLERMNEVDTKVAADRFSGFAGKWQDVIQNSPPADLSLDALENNISSFGAAKAQSFTDAHFAEEARLLDLIHHPFAAADNVKPGFQQPIGVAVFDSWLDKEHCDLNSNVETDYELLNAGAGGSERADVTECGSVMAEEPNVPDDHGTHVAGIISAAANNKGVVGLNPFAKLTFVGIDTVSLQDFKYREKVARKIFDLSFQQTKAANISWRYDNQGGDDVIARSIQNLEQLTLFVVAAGNQNQPRQGDACGDFPACYRDFPNVLTVVGLNREKTSPDLWHKSEKVGSNWGQKFGLGAIAEDVLSTIYRNRTGRMSGTSQAAPQVTAAASLIYSMYDEHFAVLKPILLPAEVKNRLIYTSELYNELLPKAQGGRLNVQRALDMATDYVEIKMNGNIEAYTGTLVDFGPGFIRCRGNPPLEISRGALRRMYYDALRRRYVLFYNSKADDRASALVRATNCDLETRSQIASIEADPDGKVVNFELREIRDFVSAMFE